VWGLRVVAAGVVGGDGVMVGLVGGGYARLRGLRGMGGGEGCQRERVGGGGFGVWGGHGSFGGMHWGGYGVRGSGLVAVAIWDTGGGLLRDGRVWGGRRWG